MRKKPDGRASSTLVMRYLVVIHGESAKVRRRDLSVSHALHRGDAVVLDEQVLRVWAVIDAPTKLGHDAIVLCGAR